MRSNAAMKIHQPGRGRGHINGTTRRSKDLTLVEDPSEQGKVADIQPARRPGEQRVLFYNLSRAALRALKAKARGTRYEGAEDISETLPCGTTVTGPLRTMDYYQHLCALKKGDDTITFSAAGQRKRGVFYPLTCGDDDPVTVALSMALAKAG